MLSDLDYTKKGLASRYRFTEDGVLRTKVIILFDIDKSKGQFMIR